MKSQTPLLNILGAKLNKDGTKLVIVLVSGHDDEKVYYNCCLKINGISKVANVNELNDENVTINIKMLKPLKENEATDDLPF